MYYALCVLYPSYFDHALVSLQVLWVFKLSILFIRNITLNFYKC